MLLSLAMQIRTCALAMALGLVMAVGGRAQPAASAPAAAAVPDDSPAARDAAIARLRAAAPGEVCLDRSTMSRAYGTTCASREFVAPPMLEAPKMAWTASPGWWGVWSPFLVGDRVLAGSCNNDTNAGLSAFDMKTGKVLWRISSVCATGHRRGTMGNVSFHELPTGEVLWIYARENGEPPDYYVLDVKAGRIVRTLTPAKRGPTRELGGVFTVLTQSTPEQTSYINALNPNLDTIVWRNDGFRLACTDKLDSRCKPVFSAPAASNGVLYQTATTKDQPNPPTRQLHAIDLHTGKTLWRHTAQPVTERGQTTRGEVAYRSDDELPMVAGGKVIIKVQGLLGTVRLGLTPNGEGLRALDAATGATLWTTRAVPSQVINNRVAAGPVLVTEVLNGTDKQLWGYRLADGSLAWRRTVSAETKLLASSGGVFYISEKVGKEDYRLQGLDGETGTLLWTTVIPGHNLTFDAAWGVQDARSGTGLQGPAWRIGRDGAIYGVSLTGVYKLQ